MLAHLIAVNGAGGGTYVEPYAGGAGAALNLLFDEHVDRITINDADPRVYAFWRAALWQTRAFVELVERAELTVAEWRRQRIVYQRGPRESLLRVGFATFYLNRCNRSGIIATGGPIGGLKQRGKWKIDARFNREDLVARILRVGSYRDRIKVTNLDAIEFLQSEVARLPQRSRPFAYLDPPYFSKAPDLYMNHYKPADHAQVARHVRSLDSLPWVLSYDDVPEIRSLYRPLRTVPLQLSYSARERRLGSEMLILKPGLVFPREWRGGIPSTHV